MTFRSVWQISLLVGGGLAQVGCDSAAFSLGRQDPAANYQLFVEVQGGDDNAMKNLIRRSDKKDIYASLQVGYILQTGTGGYKVDIPLAMDYYQRCSKQVSNCDFNLGLIYLNGLHVTPPAPNAIKAVAHFKNAAGPNQNHHLPAATQLGNIYERGFGEVAQNYGEAISWYMAGSIMGDAVAQLRIGLIKMSGADGSRDPVTARDYLTRAAGQYHFDAQYYLAKLLVEDFGDNQRAAQWLIVAGMRSPAHKVYADEFLPRLPEKMQLDAEGLARKWGNNHRPLRPVDYNSPRNNDGSRQ